MKSSLSLPVVLAVVLMVAGCGPMPFNTGNVKVIQPSNTVVTETRNPGDFSSIDMRTFGQVFITQGDQAALTVKGSDNLLPLIQTNVSNGELVIQTTENINITGMNKDNMLTFTITVRDLSGLKLSGAADVQMDSLNTANLDVVMSGAGQVTFNKLTCDSVNVTISGLGDVSMAGKATQASFDLSGAGSIKAADLQLQTAAVNLSGVGGATLWVTGSLTGTISGAGGVSYYGNPQTTTKTTGLGVFKSLGNK
jgi:hypothetical protein